MRTSSRLTAAVLVALALCLAGCGDGDDSSADNPTPTSSDSTSPSATTSTSPSASTTPASGPTIDVTISGDSVEPNGERVEVDRGDDVTLVVTADAAGEIHVHSTPEQELEYDAGTTTLTITDLDQPGVVDVESHSLDKVIVQLEVS